jgi:hypothetical protein
MLCLAVVHALSSAPFRKETAMRAVSTLIFALGLTAPAAATTCNTEILALEGWSVTLGTRSGYESANVMLAYQSTAAKPFRMIDASVRFADALGGHIALISTGRDMRLAPGDMFREEQSYLGTNLNRVVGMDRSDVSVELCTKAVVYEDGTVETFD